MATATLDRPAAARSTSGPEPHKVAILSLVCLVQLMVIIDVSIVNIALPSIKIALHFSESDLQWVVNAYTLVFGGFLLLGGRASDLIGRRLVLMGGLALFSLASLACGLSQSEGMLIGARAVQGLGGAIISPAALSILTVTFPEGRERNRALGVWGAVAGGGIALGVILGGILSQGPGWRWVFFVNVPIGILAVLLAPRLLTESRDETRERSFDIFGAVTVTAGLVLLVYAMVNTNTYGWGSARTVVELIAAVGLLVTFVAIEARFAARPLVPMRIFSSRSVSGANVVALLLGMLLFAVFFFLTLYEQQVLRFTPLEAGFSYVPFTLGIMVSSAIGSVAINRVGVKWLLSAGLLISAVGIFMMTQLPDHGSYWTNILPAFIVTSLGMGIVFLPLINAAVSGVRAEDAGLASALVNTGQQVGGAVGLALLSTFATQKTSSVLAANGKAGLDHALVAGFHLAFLIAACLAVVAAVLTVIAIPADIGRTGASIREVDLEEDETEASRLDAVPV